MDTTETKMSPLFAVVSYTSFPRFFFPSIHNTSTVVVIRLSAECRDGVTSCVDCFRVGAERYPHQRSHRYRVISGLAVPIYEPTWGADEEFLLLEAIDTYGPGAWHLISDRVGDKTAEECRAHYYAVYVHSASSPSPSAVPSMAGYDIKYGVQPVVRMHEMTSTKKRRGGSMGAAGSKQDGSGAGGAEGASGPSGGGGGAAGSSSPGGQKGGRGGTSRARVQQNDDVKPEGGEHDKTGSTRQLRIAAEAGEGVAGTATEGNMVEITGFNVKRNEFDHEWDHEAEIPIADLDFRDDDSEEIKQAKLRMLEIYNRRLDDRERVKQFILDRGLLNMKKEGALNKKRSAEEKLVRAKLRPFARLHSDDDHEALVHGLLVEQQLRLRIGQLKELRRHGIQSLFDGDCMELERRKRQQLIWGASGIGPHPLNPPTFYPTRGATGMSLPIADLQRTLKGDPYGLGTMGSGPAAESGVSDRQMRYLKSRGADDLVLPVGLAGGNALQSAPRELRGLLDQRGEGRNPNVDPIRGTDMTVLRSWREYRAGSPDAMDVEGFPGSGALSSDEIIQCAKLRVVPALYLKAKALVQAETEGGATPSVEAVTAFLEKKQQQQK